MYPQHYPKSTFSSSSLCPRANSGRDSLLDKKPIPPPEFHVVLQPTDLPDTLSAHSPHYLESLPPFLSTCPAPKLGKESSLLDQNPRQPPEVQSSHPPVHPLPSLSMPLCILIAMSQPPTLTEPPAQLEVTLTTIRPSNN